MPVGLDEITIRVRILGVFIKILHVGVGRGAVEVIIIFFDVLPVVALAIGQAEQPLLEDRVLAVPQRDGKAQPLVVVAEAFSASLYTARGMPGLRRRQLTDDGNVGITGCGPVGQ